MKSVPLALGALAALLAAPALAADLADSDRAAICGERGECSVVAVNDAGTGTKGEKLRVAEIILGLADRLDDFPEEGCRSTEAALSGDEDALDGGREFWLLAEGSAPRQVLSLCNDGYGSAGMGEDGIDIAANQLVHSQYGGSAWRWQNVRTIQLSPLKVLREESCSYHNVAPGSGDLVVIDRQTLEARSYGWATAGRSEDDLSIGCPEAMVDFNKPLDPQPDADTLGAYAVPAPFAGDAAQLPEGTTLGTCGLALSSDGRKGLLVHGKPATPETVAEMRVIAETASSLLIQIRDPLAEAALAAAKGQSWIKAPHVEIWTARDGETPEGDPMLPQKEYAQIGIGLDGAVHEGVGQPAALPKVTSWKARDAEERDVTVLRVTWDDEYGLLGGLGVVYSQAEGGKQARLISNAPIVKNRPLYLPGIWSNYPDETGIPAAACEYSGESRQLDL